MSWCALALASEPDVETEETEETEEAPERIELSTDDDVGSALDDLEEDAEAVQLEGGPGLEDWTSLPGGQLRGRWGFKPLLSVVHLPGNDGGTAVRTGAAIAHQWWTLGERTVQLGGESRLEVSAPIGGAVGRRVALDSELVPWFGPIAVRLGPGLRWDRTDWRDAGVLADGLGLGPRVGLTAEVGPLRPTVGAEADWFVVGNRVASDPASATLPVIGDETAWTAGVAWIGRPFVWSAQGQWRETAVGPVVEVGIGVHLRPF